MDYGINMKRKGSRYYEKENFSYNNGVYTYAWNIGWMWKFSCE